MSAVSVLHALAIRFAVYNFYKQFPSRKDAAQDLFGEEKAEYYNAPLRHWLVGLKSPPPEILKILYLKTKNIVFRLTTEEKLRYMSFPRSVFADDSVAWPDLPDDQLAVVEQDIGSRKNEVLAILPVAAPRQLKQKGQPTQPRAEKPDKSSASSAQNPQISQLPSSIQELGSHLTPSGNGAKSEQGGTLVKETIPLPPTRKERTSRRLVDQENREKGQPTKSGKQIASSEARPTHVSVEAEPSIFIPLTSNGLILGIQYSLGGMLFLIDQTLNAQPALRQNEDVRARLTQLVSHIPSDSPIADVALQLHQVTKGIGKYAEMSSDDPQRKKAAEQLVGPAKKLFRALTKLQLDFPEDFGDFLKQLERVTI